MAESTILEARETLHAQKTQVRVTQGAPVTVSAVIIPAGPQSTVVAENFTRNFFEKTLDKVSRPTGRGKLAHLRPTSEEFARRKQEEIDLEERQR